MHTASADGRQFHGLMSDPRIIEGHRLVSFDLGKIYADPIQFPDRMGVEIVKAIVAHSKGEDVAPETWIPTSLYRKADGEKDPSLQ